MPERVMKTPRTVDLAITSRCNLRCLYCSFFTSDLDVSKDLPTPQWLEFFQELNDCSVMDVILEGGEPLVRKDFLELVDGVVDNRMRYSILTNGTLVTDDIARHIAASRRCSQVQVSLDGSTAETHEFCRGKGNFQRAVDGLRHLLNNRVPTTVRITLHKGNVAALEESVTYLLDEVGLPEISTNSADFLGSCRQNADTVQLSVEDRSMAMDTLLRLRKKYGRRVSAMAGPQAEARQWLGIEKALREGRPSTPREGHLTACGCPMSKLSVRADGAMIPCVQLSHMVLGWINKDRLQDVWLYNPALNQLRARKSIPMEGFEYCQGCKYTKYCNGSCPATAYTVFGSIYHPSPDGCLRRFLESGGKLPDEGLNYSE